MGEEAIIALSLIIVAGIGAQLVSWWLRLPSILLLLVAGLLVGPIGGVVEPDVLLGEALFPFISLSVALILFEGGLSLRIGEIRQRGAVLRNLLTIGVATTGVLGAISSHYVLDIGWETAAVLGAIVTVTGPTVIGPMLRHIRPAGPVAATLRAEGVLVDPLGALLALLVFEVILATSAEEATSAVVSAMLKTVLAGGAIGLALAATLVFMLRRYLIPDHLHNVVTIALVVAAFVAADAVQEESGLLAATVMGIAMANQRFVPVVEILEFKETIRVLLISALFVVIGARVELDAVREIGVRGVLLIVVLVVAIRPLAVLASTIRTSASWRERALLASIAPRGIVAASVAAIFAIRLEEFVSDAAVLVPVTFLVVVGTISIYGVIAGPIARWVGLAQSNPRGILIAGANEVACAIGDAIGKYDFEVTHVDTDSERISRARLDGREVIRGNILSDQVHDGLELGELGMLLALTPNDEVNVLATHHYGRILGRRNVYQAAPSESGKGILGSLPFHLTARILFDPDLTYRQLEDSLAAGAVVRGTTLGDEFDWEAYQARHGSRFRPLFVVSAEGRLSAFTDSSRPSPKNGDTVVSLLETENGRGEARST
jgi:NhaP-type Na+/H+ or K+/H+ antiporter